MVMSMVVLEERLGMPRSYAPIVTINSCVSVKNSLCPYDSRHLINGEINVQS